MENDERFINTRYLGTSANNLPTYFNNKGVLKRYIPSRFTKKIVDKNNLWVKLNDLPHEFREELLDISNTLEEIMFEKTEIQNVLDLEEVKVYVTNDTLLLPVVNRLLASDGTPAYTIKMQDEKPILKPIIVCWNCHWSELFTGATKYGNNVFCLASDLTEEQRESFTNEFITLKEAPEYLGWNDTPQKETGKRLSIKKK